MKLWKITVLKRKRILNGPCSTSKLAGEYAIGINSWDILCLCGNGFLLGVEVWMSEVLLGVQNGDIMVHILGNTSHHITSHHITYVHIYIYIVCVCVCVWVHSKLD